MGMAQSASSRMGDSVASNAALQRALVGLVAVSLEHRGLAHALSIAITTMLFFPGQAEEPGFSLWVAPSGKGVWGRWLGAPFFR